MYFSILFIVILLIGFIIWSLYYSVNKQEENFSEEQIEENINETIEDFDEKFFEYTRNGEKYQHFLSLSSMRDCALIRGLLQADNIPSYTEGEHMNSIYGGLAGTMNAVVAIKLYILYKDYDRAIEIIKDFLEQKIERISSESEKSFGRKVLDSISTLCNVSENNSCEFLGIVILAKAKADDLLEECE